jgi:UDP-N-acetylglucosamine 2-epimerase
LSLLQFLTLLAGNSSSGIMEAASFRLPVVNVGVRQKGREHAGNVVHCGAQRDAIAGAMRLALSHSFRSSLHDLKNPYGDGHAAEKIADVLSALDLSELVLAKQPAPIYEEAIS